jgi:hypothetical protein
MLPARDDNRPLIERACGVTNALTNRCNSNFAQFFHSSLYTPVLPHHEGGTALAVIQNHFGIFGIYQK